MQACHGKARGLFQSFAGEEHRGREFREFPASAGAQLGLAQCGGNGLGGMTLLAQLQVQSDRVDGVVGRQAVEQLPAGGGEDRGER